MKYVALGPIRRMRRAYLENPRGELEAGRPLLAPRFDTFATIITMPYDAIPQDGDHHAGHTFDPCSDLLPSSRREFLLAQLVFLLNMRVYHFLA
jgi:hypothetical protein